MMPKHADKKTLTILLILVGLLILIGLLVFFVLPMTRSQPAPLAVSTLATNTEAVTATMQPATATPLPTSTSTSQPSPTPIPPLAIAKDGLTVWCYPDNQISAPPVSDTMAEMPVGVRSSTIEEGIVQVVIPNYSCNYVFNFNQKPPEGLMLEIYDWLQKQPVFSLPLKPASDKSTAAVAYTKNAYLTSPPVWEYTYRFVVKDAAGAELWNNQVHLDKGWRPNICLAGVLPNPKTLRCPLRQDSHPWDAWYGKTPVPNDDENPIP